MAKVCSVAGDMNIAVTEEAVGDREIDPEIKVDESTRDPNTGCCLESEECDEIIEHLKSNPGLVVKSMGVEGQIVLHVAVMVGETSKSKPPTSECTDKGLREAAVDSDWYCALRDSDCKVLMSLMRASPCLVARVGPEGCTVLHAAAKRGCLQLLKQVFDLFKGTTEFVDEMSRMKVDLDVLRNAKYGLFQAEASHIARFTCPRQFWLDLTCGPSGLGCLLMRKCRFDAFGHVTEKLVEMMEGEISKKAFERIERYYKSDKDYNFVLERKELRFHFACALIRSAGADYVKTIIDACLELRPPGSVEVLTYIFQLHNAQGQTPFHVALTHLRISVLLELLPRDDAYKNCFNAKDVRGWTILHYAATTPRYGDQLKKLLEDGRIDVNVRTSVMILDQLVVGRREWGMTALHLAILHRNRDGVELLLKCPRTDENVFLYRDIGFGYDKNEKTSYYSRDRETCLWAPLQLAIIMGLSNIVRPLLAKIGEICSDEKLQNEIGMEEMIQEPVLFLASASGNPDTLRLFLDHPKFNPLVRFEGATALHYAANAMIPTTNPEFGDPKVGRFLFLSDLPYMDCETRRYEEEVKDVKLTLTSYLGREACITMLLQAGVDIWEKDNLGRLANPGPQAPEEAHLWWHEKMAQETLEAKKSLNDAANAISVVAALVATASFVGPLQPPLGYGGDSLEGGVQDTYLSIRVFMVSNILSFYLAVASILFAVVPSLPMPQEGIFAEWQRTRRTVGVAIFFLLMSVLGVLISFGAASNSVVSEGYSWRHDGLSFFPTLVGGFICILGISLFFLRLLRLVFNRNAKIRYLYKTFVKF